MPKFLDIWTAEKIRVHTAYRSIEDTGFAGNDGLTGNDWLAENNKTDKNNRTNGTREPLNRQDLDAYTKDKLKETIEHAVKNSSFYKEKLGKVLVQMDICNHILGEYPAGARYKVAGFWKTFRTIPFTTADELCRRGDEFLCVSPNEISRIVTLDTSGSTGTPKRVYFTEEDQQLTVDYFENGMQLIVDSGDKVLILMPAKMPGSIGRLLGQGLRNFGAEAIEYGLPGMQRKKGLAGEPAEPEITNEATCELRERSDNETSLSREIISLLDLINREKITSVVALPTHMRLLADAVINMADNIFSPPKLQSVLLSAEYVSDEDVKLIEKAFDCKVYEHYGMTEMGLGCAVSCGQGEGYHIREADLYIEIIDPKTGENIEDGRTGEIVFTTLTRKGMPFIRYRTGDYSRWITEECPCGSRLKRIAKVEPRKVTKGYL